jgi:hypothetical protein
MTIEGTEPTAAPKPGVQFHFNPQALLVTLFWIGLLALLSISDQTEATARLFVSPLGMGLVAGLYALSISVARRLPALVLLFLKIALLLTGLRLLWKLVVFAWS